MRRGNSHNPIKWPDTVCWASTEPGVCPSSTACEKTTANASIWTFYNILQHACYVLMSNMKATKYDSYLQGQCIKHNMCVVFVVMPMWFCRLWLKKNNKKNISNTYDCGRDSSEICKVPSNARCTTCSEHHSINFPHAVRREIWVHGVHFDKGCTLTKFN